MIARIGWLVLYLLLCTISEKAYCQQDVDFHLSAHLLSGKKIIKVKRDYYDPYLWVLAQNNQVYRINSLTLATDDYTATFANYANLQFTDIAGLTQDTVFVGTNSNNVIEYKKGILKTIGVSGIINQVGMDHLYNEQPNCLCAEGENSILMGRKLMMIGTTTNMYYYDCESEVVSPFNLFYTGPPVDNRLFETTYRTEAYSNLELREIYDPTVQYSITSRTLFTIWNGAVTYNTPQYGYHINSVYYLTGNITPDLNYNDSQYLNQLWGTENGLFENTFYASSDTSIIHLHYLSGIKVNKVTSIYGLVTFPNLTKENLLVGTDNGLYFSSSGYHNFYGFLAVHNTFTLDADIGNQPINDICVNATSYLHTAITCEDAAWVATNNGLYFIKPDYSNYISTAPIKAIGFQNQPDTLSNLNICSTDSTVAAVNTAVYKGINIQWYKNGIELPTESNDTLNIKSSGDYNAVLYDPCENIHIASNHLKVNVISGPVFTFNYPDKLQYCDSLSTKLNVTYSPSYHYRWYQDGTLNGDTTSFLVATHSGKYKVEVSACSNSWVPSKEVQVNLLSVPNIEISPTQISYCQGDSAVLSSTEIVDTAFTVNWYKDNILLPAYTNKLVVKTVIPGSYTIELINNSTLCSKISPPFLLGFTQAPVFAFNYPASFNYCAGSAMTLKVQGDPSYQYRWYKDDALNGMTGDSITVTQTGRYKVEVSACQNSWIPSQAVKVNFIQIPIPIIKPDKPAYCIGDQATLNLNIPVDPTYNITWLRDGIPVDSYHNLAVITTNIPGSYTALVSSTAITNCLQTSSPVQITFNPPPTVSIVKNANNTLCQGQEIDLKAIYNNGSIKWSTGETTDIITVNAAGIYNVTLTSAAGCIADTSIAVSFLPLPVFTVNDTTICTYKNQSVTLTAPAGFSKYLWNNQQAAQTFTVTTPQTVNLTVIDANGCQASQQIHVTEQCPEVEIPNAFTPNSDGINDTWIIEGIDNDPTVSLKVFNRYGILVYKSNGYLMPWNGKYNGSKLPAGVYYYILNTKKGKQTFSGSVTILY